MSAVRALPDPSEHGWGRARRHLLFWPTLITLVYLAVTLTVMVVEYVSEMSKIARGFHTDTFSPFLFTNLLTYPASAAHADWHGYPEAFGLALARRTVQDAVGPVLLNVGIEAALVAAIALLATWADRRMN